MDNLEKKEIGVSLTKALFSNIPYVGQILSEVFFEYRGRIKQERLNKFTILLSDYFSQNCDFNIKNIQSEDFGDLLESVIKRVIQTKSEEKLNRYRDILTNNISEMRIDYDNSERYLDLISTLSELEINILKSHRLFDDKFDSRIDEQDLNKTKLVQLINEVQKESDTRDKGYANNWQETVKKYNATKNAIRTVDEQNNSVDIYRKAEFYNLNDENFIYYKQKLFSLGLLIDTGIGRSGHKPFTRMTITEFAKKFLDFIENSA